MRSWDEGDASVPSPHNPSPAPTGTKALPRRHHNIPTRRGGRDAYRGRYFEGEEGVPVGAGVVGMWGGDACVAHEGWDQATGDWDEGDASVPTHLIRHPRPYGDEGASEATL